MKVFLRHVDDVDGSFLGDVPLADALKLPEQLKEFGFQHAEDSEHEFKIGAWQVLLIDSDGEIYLEIGYEDA